MTDEDRAILDAMPLHQPMTSRMVAAAKGDPARAHSVSKQLVKLRDAGFLEMHSTAKSRRQWMRVKAAPGQVDEKPTKYSVTVYGAPCYSSGDQIPARVSLAAPPWEAVQ